VAKAKQKQIAERATSFFRVTDETRQWAALIAGEVTRWPRVSTRKMFGLNSFYRGAAIFGAVPDRRALFSANSVIFKFGEVTPRLQKRLQADPKVKTSRAVDQNWFSFELAAPEDIHGAIAWLSEAYEWVARPGSSPRTGRKSPSSARSGKKTRK
jgi:hypothetical protein